MMSWYIRQRWQYHGGTRDAEVNEGLAARELLATELEYVMQQRMWLSVDVAVGVATQAFRAKNRSARSSPVVR